MWWQVYQLQTELQSVQMENVLQKQRSIRCASAPETPQLQEEVRSLRCQLAKAQTLDPVRRTHTHTLLLCPLTSMFDVRSSLHDSVRSLLTRQARQDILAQDLAEAIDSQVELAEQLRCYREENEKLHRDKQEVSLCGEQETSSICKIPF